MTKDDRNRSDNKIASLDKYVKDWREMLHENGATMFAKDGTLLDQDGNRSIFDDVDE